MTNWEKLEKEDEEDKQLFLEALMHGNGAILNMIMKDVYVALTRIIEPYVEFELYSAGDLTKRKLFIDEKKCNKEIADLLQIKEDNYVRFLPFPDNPRFCYYYLKRHTLLQHLITDRYPDLQLEIEGYLDEVGNKDE